MGKGREIAERAMERLKDFVQKDMIEQITLLEEVKEDDHEKAVPALLALYAEPLPDQAVDEMVYHTLFEMLATAEKQTVAALRHASPRVQLLAVRRAGESGFRAALPTLIELLAIGESEILAEAIRALGCFHEPVVVNALLPLLHHPDYAVTAWAMRALAKFPEPRVREALKNLISTDPDLPQGECDLRVALAVQTLASFKDEETIDFLIGHIHHHCPAFRKEIASALANMGELAIPTLKRCLMAGDKDERIMAANVLGIGGSKKAADVLVEELQHPGLDPNLKFAIYEALGRIPSMRSVVGLFDGLSEENEMVLLAVIIAMDQLCNPSIVKALGQILDGRDELSERILRAIVTAQATRLFTALHPDYGKALVSKVLSVGNPQAVAIFRSELERLEGEWAAADLARVVTKTDVTGRRILAADDSKAMIFFYKGVAAELKLNLLTAADGKEALECLRGGVAVDLLITDMNMPNMDGVELAREVRQLPQGRELPILMATTESECSQVDLALAAGVNGFISKPFTSEQLRAKMGEVFAKG